MTGLTLSPTGVHLLSRCIQRCHLDDAASVFREKWKDVVKRADNIQGQVAAMEEACGKETAVQVCGLKEPFNNTTSSAAHPRYILLWAQHTILSAKGSTSKGIPLAQHCWDVALRIHHHSG